MAVKLQVKNWSFYIFTDAPIYTRESFLHYFIKYEFILIIISKKEMNNKSKTSLIFTTDSYNIVIFIFT